MRSLSVIWLVLFSVCAHAEVYWSDFSVTYLRGTDYEVGDSNRSVLTFEHAASTSWGDSFLFVDRLESDNGDDETYGEWGPRLRLTELDNKVVTALYIATQIEMQSFSADDGFSSSFTNYLWGLGTDIAMPGFDYFSVNFYRRNNDDYDNNYQTTVVWGLPIGPLYYDGFMDYTTSTDFGKPSMNITSQLKYDLGPLFSLKSKLFVGVEYVYWRNKFGIDNVDENNVNLLIKYHF